MLSTERRLPSGAAPVAIFIGVYGIEPTNLLWVSDPIYGQSLVSTSTLTGGTYQGNGTWTNTYFTK